MKKKRVVTSGEICPFCSGTNTILFGSVPRKNKKLKKYYCKNCEIFYTENSSIKITDKNIIHQGLDYLRFYVIDENFSLKWLRVFEGLNPANSNESKIVICENELTINCVDSDQGKSYLLNFDGSPIFRFVLLNAKQKKFIGKKNEKNIVWRIDIYGRIFSLIRLGILSENMLMYFTQYITELTRLDYCLDLSGVTPICAMKLFRNTRKPEQWITRKNEVETLYYGDYSVKNNRRLLIRIYEKIREITKKKKTELFPDYLEYDSVARIEFEIRNETIKEHSFTLPDALISDKLKSFLQSVSHTRYTDFRYDFSSIRTEKRRKISEEATISYFLPRMKTIVQQLKKHNISEKKLMEIMKKCF
jgi:hypothetical protein